MGYCVVRIIHTLPHLCSPYLFLNRMSEWILILLPGKGLGESSWKTCCTESSCPVSQKTAQCLNALLPLWAAPIHCRENIPYCAAFARDKLIVKDGFKILAGKAVKHVVLLILEGFLNEDIF